MGDGATTRLTLCKRGLVRGFEEEDGPLTGSGARLGRDRGPWGPGTHGACRPWADPTHPTSGRTSTPLPVRSFRVAGVPEEELPLLPQGPLRACFVPQNLSLPSSYLLGQTSLLVLLGELGCGTESEVSCSH